MSRIAKTIVIILILIIFIIIFGVINMSRQESGYKTPGLLSLVLLFGVIAAVRAVFKHKPEDDKKNDNNDKYKLDKS